MTDNLKIFEELVFRIPKASKLVKAILVLGMLYSIVFYYSMLYFTSITAELYYILLMALLGFLMPFLIGSELFYLFLEDFPRRWSYFAALISQFLFFVYAVILTGADNFINAWHIFWIALLTLYLFNLLTMLITQGYRKLLRINGLSLVQPVILLAMFHAVVGRSIQITLKDYLSSFLVLLAGSISFLAIFALSEYFMRVNAKGLSVIELIEGLINKKEKPLDLGYPAFPEVQTLEIENESSKVSFCVPWVHPGPIEGFGGGRLTSKIIDKLNEEGKGFFLHVPSTHKSDLADPTHYRKLLDAMSKPERAEKASKLIEKRYEDVKFYGRTVGEQKIVYMDADFDDYEVSIFKEAIDFDEVLLVDLHNHERHDRGREVWYRTEEAEKLRENLLDFLGELEGLEKYEYSSGFSVNLDDRPAFALIEEIYAEETLIFGIEGNGTSKKIREFKQELEDSYDNVINFSTDTHSDIHQYKNGEQVGIQTLKDTIKDANRDVTDARIGFKSKKSEQVRMLMKDYFGLIMSVNILIRLLMLSLILMYIGLVILIFF